MAQSLANGHGPRCRPPAGVDSGGHLLTVVRPTAPGRTRTGGGTHRSRPTNHMGSPLMFVGRHLRVPPCGIWDGPLLHPGESVPAAGASPRPTGRKQSVFTRTAIPHCVGRGFTPAVPYNVPVTTAPRRTRTGGGTHRSRPTNHMGSPLMFVGRHLRVPPCGIWDGPLLHPGEPVPAAGASPRPTNDDGSSYKFVGDDAHIVPAAQCRQTQRTQANAYQRTDAPRHDVRRCGVRADVGIGPYRVCAYTNQPITRTIPLPPGLTL